MAAPLGSCGCWRIWPISQRLLAQNRYLHKSSVSGSVQEQQVSVSTHEVQDVPSPKAADGGDKIVIPRRIKREPTAILKALASTVSRDFDAPRYPFIDDPYLLPKRVLEKRTYMVSKAAGKRAAHYVIQNYPRFFEGVFEAEPDIEAFIPKPPTDKFKHDELTLEGLDERITARKPEQAYDCYQLLKEQGTEIPQATYNRLLDVLCVYNCTNEKEDAYPEEIWALSEVSHKHQELLSVWSSNTKAEEVFEDMPEKNAWAYSSLIRGMAMFGNIEEAMTKLQEMRTCNLSVDLETYNTVIRNVIHMRQSGEEKLEIILNLLKEMQKAGLKPNVHTFNNALYSLSQQHIQMREAKAWVMMILNEMKECGIEPTLATWCHILNTHYSRRRTDATSNNRILHEIIGYLEDKKLNIQHADDVNFFVTAMDKCALYLKDLHLGYKIDALVNKAGNDGLLTSSIGEFNYYSNYLMLLCEFESIDKIIDEYERIYRNAVHPTFKSLLTMFDVLELHGAYHYFPVLYSDMVKLSYERRENLLTPLLNILAKQKHEKSVQDQLIGVVKKIQARAEEDQILYQQNDLRAPLVLTGKMLDNMIVIYLNGDDIEGAWSCFEYYKKEAKKVEGFMGELGLGKLLSACVKEQNNNRTLLVLSEMASLGYTPSSSQVKEITSGLSLEEDEMIKLRELFPKTKWNVKEKKS